MIMSHGPQLGITGTKTLFILVGLQLKLDAATLQPSEGGDDLKMKAWDVRQGFTQPLFVNKRYGLFT